jgi:hypothetical protein
LDHAGAVIVVANRYSRSRVRVPRDDVRLLPFQDADVEWRWCCCPAGEWWRSRR